MSALLASMVLSTAAFSAVFARVMRQVTISRGKVGSLADARMRADELSQHLDVLRSDVAEAAKEQPEA